MQTFMNGVDCELRMDGVAVDFVEKVTIGKRAKHKGYSTLTGRGKVRQVAENTVTFEIALAEGKPWKDWAEGIDDSSAVLIFPDGKEIHFLGLDVMDDKDFGAESDNPAVEKVVCEAGEVIYR